MDQLYINSGQAFPTNSKRFQIIDFTIYEFPLYSKLNKAGSENLRVSDFK